MLKRKKFRLAVTLTVIAAMGITLLMITGVFKPRKLFISNQTKQASTVPVTSVTVSPSSATLQVGQNITLNANVSPSNATNRTVNWTGGGCVSLSNGSGSSVTILATNIGTCSVVAKSLEGPSIEVKITVKPATVTDVIVTAENGEQQVTATKTLQLTAHLIPENATNKSITWTSSDPSVATVTGSSTTATLRGLQPGTVTIEARSEDGPYGTIIIDVVKLPVSSVNFTVSNPIYVGDTKNVTATINPSNATNQSITWTSSDPSVATVTATNNTNAVITAKAVGSTKITAKSSDGPYYSYTIQVKPVEVSQMGLNAGPTSVRVGETIPMVVTVGPSNATDKTVTWTSSDTNIATISNVSSDTLTAQIKGIKPGTVTIKAQSSGDPYMTRTITVTKVPVSSLNVSIPQSTIEVGNTMTINASVSPTNATYPNITWTTSNSNIATISASNSAGTSAKFTAKAAGTVTITATADGISKSLTITVNPRTVTVTDVTISPTSASLQVGKTATFTATVKPTNATNKNITWSVSNSSILSITNSSNTQATIKALAPGTATLKAKTADGNYVASASITVTSPTVSVTSVTVSPSEASVSINGTLQLTPNVKPSTATNRSVTWSSSNPSVATVSNTGLVTGKAAGTATITVKTNDGNKTATSTITVTDSSITVIHPEGVTLTPASDTIAVGATKALTATVTPEDAADKSITWSSSDTNIATVSDLGEVTAIAEGNATITATTVDGNKTATSAITIIQASAEDVEVTGITVTPTILTVEIDDTVIIEATIIPENATNQKITWTSSNPEIATVSDVGEVKGIKKGTVTITATTEDGSKSATSEVHVVKETQQIEGPDKETTAKIGEQVDLTKVLSITASEGNKITWKSSDETVATVDETGKVLGVSAGVATITAYDENDQVLDSIKVSVVAGTSEEIKPQEEIPINPKTGAFASLIAVIVLLGLFIFIKFKNKSYINKI